MPSRFGQLDSRGIIDYHWNSLEGPSKWNGPPETYDPAYVHPSSFPATFDGCPTAAEQEKAGTNQPTDNTYVWTFANPDVPGGTDTVSGQDCIVDYDRWTAEGDYAVSLTIQNPDGTAFEGRAEPYDQTVRINDLLIVSLGDSYASGEGSPDKQAVNGNLFDQKFVFEPAVWQDRRCHRSASAGPAKAALALEGFDRHTSVTFLSFACSGATIDTPYFDGGYALDPYRPGDPAKPKGSGVLGSYLGVESPDPDLFNPFNDPDYDNHVPSQIAQLKDAVRSDSGSSRRIDALLVSGGGNDIGFGPVASICTLYGNCRDHFVYGARGEGLRPLHQRLDQDLADVHPKYDALDAALENPASGFDIGKVYVTEYPDPTRDDDGAPCGEMLEDVIPWAMSPLLALAAATPPGAVVPLPWYRLDSAEAEWASSVVLPGLNGVVSAAAQRHGWTYVDGVSARFAGPGYGHGYCASNAWIRRASDSIELQGPWYDGLPPDTTKTTGTLHPTARGYEEYAKRILAYLRPDLLGQPAQPATPLEFIPSSQALGSTAREGDHGWLTGRCADGVCTSDSTVAAVEVTHAAGLRGVRVRVNGVVGCNAAGVTCTTSTTTTNDLVTGYRWQFEFAADGVYRLEFSASAANGATDTFSEEVKVDLHDPTEVTATTSAAAEPVDGRYRVPVEITFGGTDAVGGSGIAGVEYDLDGEGFVRAGDGEKIMLEENGEHSLTVRSLDWAGRKSAPLTSSIQIDRSAPPVASFSYSPSPAQRGDLVTFTDTSTDDEGVSFQSWSVNGGYYEGPTVEVSKACETLEVELTVYDDAGQWDTESATIAISDVPETIYVPAGGDLSAAVEAACPGDTIELAAGTFTGGVVLTDVNLRGAGAGSSIVSGFGSNDSGWVLHTHGNDVSVEGVTIRDGGIETNGGGVQAFARTKLLDVEVAFNGGEGGIRMRGAGEVRDSFLHHNTNSVDGGGGISMFCCGDLTVTGSEISFNSAVGDGGGAAFAEASADAPFTFARNYVHDNSSDGSGGGLKISIAVASVLNNRFVENSAQQGGGVGLRHSNVLFAGNLIADNEGGGLHRSGDSGALDVVNSTIAGNEGAGLTDDSDLTSSTATALFNTIVTGNAPDVVGTPGSTGNNLIGVAAGFVGSGDYHLAAGSAAIDAGDNSKLPPALTKDADGDERVFDADGDGTATVDIGYDETGKVSDDTPPSVTATPDRDADHAGWYTAPVTVTFSGTDSGSGIASCDAPVRYGGPDSDSASVTGTCTDNAGNAGAATFHFKFDDDPPTLTAPGNVTVDNDPGMASASVSDAAIGAATATDNAGPATIVRSGVPTGNIFPLGPTTITYTATDAAGNDTTATQLVTVVDAEPPVLTVPADVTVDSDPGAASAFVSNAALGSATATDNAGPVTILRGGVPTGNIFPLGLTTIMYFATDAVGNQTIATQSVTVTAGDDEAPNLVVPAAMIVDATMPTGAVVTFAASATDDTDPNPVVSCTPASGSTFAIGVTTVRCTATDNSGNSSEASFTVTVNGPVQQIIDLIDKTLAFMDQPQLEATLKEQLKAVAAALVANRPTVVCRLLDGYIVVVNGASARAGLTQAEKAELIKRATRIKAVVGCR